MEEKYLEFSFMGKDELIYPLHKLSPFLFFTFRKNNFMLTFPENFLPFAARNPLDSFEILINFGRGERGNDLFIHSWNKLLLEQT